MGSQREISVSIFLQRGAIPSMLTSPNISICSQPSQTLPKHSPKIRLQLMCLSTGCVKSIYETSNLSTATPQDVATAVSNINTEWPYQGTLIVEVNSHKSFGKTWLPRRLVGCCA